MNTKNMGIGKLGDSNITLVRQFRSTFGADHLDPRFTLYASFDWIKKQIAFSQCEVFMPNGVPVINWATAMEKNEYPSESMTLVTFDGNGEELYRICFKGLKILERSSMFDYASSEVALHRITVSYEEAERQNVFNT